LGKLTIDEVLNCKGAIIIVVFVAVVVLFFAFFFLWGY